MIIQKLCLQCHSTISPNLKKNIFCCHSCAATYNNNQRIKNGYIVTAEHRKKTSDTLRTKFPYTRIYYCSICNKISKWPKSAKQCCIPKPPRTSIIQKQKEKIIIGPHSKLFYPNCKSCKNKFISRTCNKQYCCACYQNSSNKRSFYRFTFNLFDYPLLFDLTLVKQIGFYGPLGKCKHWNLSGLSRDHKVSISEAIKYNYDPYYISHPMNCELMPQSTNNKKKVKSSITYDELIELVKTFDNQM